MKGLRRIITLFSAAAILSFACMPFVHAGAASYTFTKNDTGYDALKLKAAPAVVADICDSRNVQFVTDGEIKATNALIRVDDEGNVADARGNTIEPLNQFFGEMSKKVIPNFLVESAEGLNAVVTYASSQPRFGDAAVVSGDPDILKSARRRLPYLRRIYDASSVTVFDGKAIAGTANESGAVAVVLGSGIATRGNVEYLQQRMKSVWVRLDEKDEFAAFKGIASGALGLITQGNPLTIADAYQAFESELKPTLSRAPLNVAHRGLPYDCNENSLEGFAAAIAAGATHLEVDAHLTSDGHIVIMHDGTLNRTTNIDPATVPTTSISSMTLETLRQYRIIKNYAGNVTGTESVIPTIDEVFELCKEKDILLFFEIKTSNVKFAAEFKKKIEEYGMQEKIVVISFDNNALNSIRTQIPYLWALDLNDKKATLAETVTYFCENDRGCDMSQGNLSVMRDLLERGFAPGAWTYESKSSFKTAALEGVYAITNNEAAECSVFPRAVTLNEITPVAKSEIESKALTVGAQATAYNGDTKDCTAKILSYRDMGDHAEAVFLVNAGDWNMVSDVVKLEYAVSGKGCNAGISCLSFTAVPVIVALGLVVYRKNRKSV